MAEFVTDVVVRRRRALTGVIAAASTGLAAGYLWRFFVTGGAPELVLGILLGVIGGCYAFAWLDARTPLLVADAKGMRVRLGPAWTGVPWESVDHVEVQERGRVKDGQVKVLVSDSADVVTGNSRRSRWAAWRNRRLYGVPLVAPYGLTTSVSVPDIAGSLERLAGARAQIAVLDGREPDAETVVASPTTASADPADAAPTPEPDRGASTNSSAETAPVPGPKRRFRAAREAWRPTAGASPAVAYATTPARREDVTISLHDPATFGTLALSSSAPDSSQTLPEIQHLRRHSEPDRVGGSPPPSDDPAAGNVSLIIDATTDLSARAMQRVRSSRPPGGTGDDIAASSTPTQSDLPEPATIIGAQLTEARNTLGLSVDELADRTRIRPSVIESIEMDDFSPCGGDFYAKGHLRMLARVLGIDAAPLLARYDDTFASSPVKARDVFEVELATGSTGVVRGGSSGANWGALVAAVLVLLVVWGVARSFTNAAVPEQANPRTTQSAPALGPRTPGRPPTPAPEQAHVKLTAVGGDAHVVVRDRSGHLVFSGKLVDGAAKKVQGEAPLRVRSSDGGVISLSVKGKHLGALGATGSPAHRLIRASGSR